MRFVALTVWAVASVALLVPVVSEPSPSDARATEREAVLVSFGPDDDTVLIADGSGRVTEWPLSGTDPVAVYDAGAGMSGRRPVVVTPGGERIAVLSDDGMVRVWDRGDTEPVLSVTAGEVGNPSAGELSMSANGASIGVLVVPREGSPKGVIIDGASGEVLRVIENATTAPVFSANGVGDAGGMVASESGEPVVYSLADTDNGDIEPAGGEPFEAVAVSWAAPDRVVASGPSGGFVVYDTNPIVMRPVARLDSDNGVDGSADRIVVDPKGWVVAIFSNERDAVVTRRIHNGERREQYVYQSGEVAVGPSGVAFSPDGLQLVTAEERVVVWDRYGAEVLLELELGDPAVGVRDVAFSHDGAMVVGVLATGEARVWDSTTGEVLADIPSLAEHPSG